MTSWHLLRARAMRTCALSSQNYLLFVILFTLLSFGSAPFSAAEAKHINVLTVTPAAGIPVQGAQGGPFAPPSGTYTLTTDDDGFDFTISVDQPWITLSRTSGTISILTQATVDVSINENANSLSPGTYVATITFINLYNGEGDTTRTVTLTVLQASGQVVLRVLSPDGDGTFSFSSATAALQTTLTTNGGSAQTSANLAAGTYSTTLNLPANFALRAASCSDDDSGVDVASRTATIRLQPSESVTCTFETGNSRRRTSQIINRFLHHRGNLLLSNEAGGSRQIDRLTGSSSAAPGGGAGPGFIPANTFVPQRLGGPTAALPDQEDGFRNGFAFAMSLQQILRASATRRREAGAEDALAFDGAPSLLPRNPLPRWDIWLEGSLTSFDSGRSAAVDKGHFGLVYAGADYLLTPGILIGALVQYDDLDQRTNAQSSRVYGTGWLAGPYTTIRLTENLFLQARTAWGASDNTISPYGTYEDAFATRRWLSRTGLVGNWQHGPWQFRPQASIAYLTDAQEAYTNSLGVAIPGQTLSLGQIKFGPEIAYRHGAPNEVMLEPRVALEGIWNFDRHTKSSIVIDEQGATEELRGRVEVGARVIAPGGLTFSATASYDGIGTSSYEAVSGRLLLTIPLP